MTGVSKMVLKLNVKGLYECPVKGCPKAYKPRQSLVAHIKRKHEKPKQDETVAVFEESSQVEKDLADLVEDQELLVDVTNMEAIMNEMQQQLVDFDEEDLTRYTVATPLEVEEEEVDEALWLGASSMMLSLKSSSLERLLEEAGMADDATDIEVEKTTVEEEEGNDDNVVEVLTICGECTYLFKTEAEAWEHMEAKHREKACTDCGLYSNMIKKVGDRMRKAAADKRSNVAENKELKRQLEETKTIMEENIKLVHSLTSENESLKRLREIAEKAKEETNAVKKRPALVRSKSDPELVKRGAAVLERSAIYPVNCKKCDFTCVMVDNLLKHIKMKHKGQDEIIDVDEFSCDQCDESPNSRSELMNHIVEKHSDPVKEVKCGKCISKFTDENEMKMHKCSMDPKLSQWTCHFCKSVFKGVEARDKHVCFKHPYQSVEIQRKRVYKNTTECKWGAGCRHMARNMCWFRHTVVVNPQPQEVQVEEIKEGGQEEQAWQVPSRRRQGGRGETRYCSYQENCDRRDTCRFKHIDSLNYLSSTMQENF